VSRLVVGEMVGWSWSSEVREMGQGWAWAWVIVISSVDIEKIHFFLSHYALISAASLNHSGGMWVVCGARECGPGNVSVHGIKSG
jgi:hypothetical protein